MPLPLPGGPNRTALIPLDGVSSLSFGATFTCGDIFCDIILLMGWKFTWLCHNYLRGNATTFVKEAAINDTEVNLTELPVTTSDYRAQRIAGTSFWNTQDACVSKSAVGEFGLCPMRGTPHLSTIARNGLIRSSI